MNLTDLNDNAPQFESSQPVNVEENRGGGSLITTVRATDADQGANAALSYTITGGDQHGRSIVDHKISTFAICITNYAWRSCMVFVSQTANLASYMDFLQNNLMCFELVQ